MNGHDAHAGPNDIYENDVHIDLVITVFTTNAVRCTCSLGLVFRALGVHHRICTVFCPGNGPFILPITLSVLIVVPATR
jgi:hypothetical protein